MGEDPWIWMRRVMHADLQYAQPRGIHTDSKTYLANDGDQDGVGGVGRLTQESSEGHVDHLVMVARRVCSTAFFEGSKGL